MVQRVVRSLTRDVAKTLATVGADVAGQVSKLMAEAEKVTKADDGSDDNAAAITPLLTTVAVNTVADDIDLSGLDVLVDVLAADLADVGSDTGVRALAQLGAPSEDALVNQINEAAIAQSRARAAELVGKRFLADGTLIDNPDARYAITQSTRDAIRDTITKGLADNIGIPGISDAIESSFAFSTERAALIANTEVRRANSYGALEGYKAVRSTGVDVMKEWLTAADCDDEEVCLPNADDGPINLDDTFSSGDDAPPGHPNCRCSLGPVVNGSEE